MSRFVPTVYAEATTWTRDSHDLFDYESQHVVRTEFALNRTVRFVRRNADVRMEDASIDALPSREESDYLMKCINFDTRYMLQPADKQADACRLIPKKLWLVIRELGPHTLTEGDIIKLGRFKLRVRQLCAESEDQLIRPDLSGSECATSVARCAPPEADGMPCRICLLEASGSDEEDPLIEACACRGSIRYVHLGCLRHWIQGRLCLGGNEGHNSPHTYLFRQLTCELCRTSYPMNIVFSDGSMSQLVPMPETKAPYLVLENMMRIDPAAEGGEGQSSIHSRGVYVISLAGKKALKLGRGHESDVRIADVSISRWHATVSFAEDGRFILEDHNSKFGTLVAMRRPKLIDASTGDDETDAGGPVLTVQAGRTVFRLSTRQPRYEAVEDAGMEAVRNLILGQGEAGRVFDDQQAL
ncbi:hypothetical protein FOL47_007325 [Perkinsus chesapeaki]|uniref:Uncharacterized protein n=1 Tax=Perkinsus chesapeaki TaxID=330153 RepID=A0A7J6MWC8_PERCH|nr:hypothetical protein FOL47_007325 [Perkinsus chesapeaki]